MKELYRYNDKVYIIVRRIPHHNLHKKDGTLVTEALLLWKEHLGADHVLKTSEHYMFCITVPDIEWEEVTEDEQKTHHISNTTSSN